MADSLNAGQGGNDHDPSALRKVRVLINPHSGTQGFTLSMQRKFEAVWDVPGIDLTYQFSRSIEDGRAKTLRAIEEGVDTILAIGGDGMVNTVGSLLIHTPVALGVIPAGSGNGFARHFNIPLDWARAAAALASGVRRKIDVGTLNGRPFLTTCSMAWDASVVRWFEKSPVRGIAPYVLAAAYGLFEYTPQAFRFRFDDGEEKVIDDAMVCTAANITQFGGGARIAPHARPDDGHLELVLVRRRDAGRVFANLGRLFNGTLDALPEVHTRRFRKLEMHCNRPAPVQVDGEILPPATSFTIGILPSALNIIAPAGRSSRDAQAPGD